LIKKDANFIKKKIYELKEKLNISMNKEKKINSLIEDYWKNKNERRKNYKEQFLAIDHTNRSSTANQQKNKIYD